MPHLQQLYERYRGAGFAMVALNIAPDEDAQVAAWRAKGGYTFPIVLASSEAFARTTYGVGVAPFNLLLNEEGKALCRYVGVATGSEAMLEGEIRALLGLTPAGPGQSRHFDRVASTGTE